MSINLLPWKSPSFARRAECWDKYETSDWEWFSVRNKSVLLWLIPPSPSLLVFWEKQTLWLMKNCNENWRQFLNVVKSKNLAWTSNLTFKNFFFSFALICHYQQYTIINTEFCYFIDTETSTTHPRDTESVLISFLFRALKGEDSTLNSVYDHINVSFSWKLRIMLRWFGFLYWVVTQIQFLIML